jgi:hypothetical protein
MRPRSIFELLLVAAVIIALGFTAYRYFTATGSF